MRPSGPPGGGALAASNERTFRRIQVCVFLDHGRSAPSWGASHAHGERHERTPYSFGLARSELDVVFAIDHPERRGVKLMRRMLTRCIGFDLVHAWRNRGLLLAVDVV